MKNKIFLNRRISTKTVILPKIIPLIIPGFEKHAAISTVYTLSINTLDSLIWFKKFVDLLESKIGKEYLPVMRLSDGEYQFILGLQPPVYYGKLMNYLKSYLGFLNNKLNRNKTFAANTLPGVSSGSYSKKEVLAIKTKYTSWMKKISENGILALHLTYAPKPFQEQYHYSLKKWLDENNIVLSPQNYFPFYFVYAALRGDDRHRILKNRNILIIHSATGKKRDKIISSLKKEGVRNIEWLAISPSKSLFDKIDIDHLVGKVDLALIGAGVGKPNILVQLEKLDVPCIDAGFVFEVWTDENNKWLRPIMVRDDEWDEEKVRFI